MTEANTRGTKGHLADLFLNELRRQLLDLTYTMWTDEDLELIVPAAHPEVGGCYACADDEQIIVGWEKYLPHGYFSPLYDTDLPRAEAEAKEVREAVAYIRDIVEDKVVLRVVRKGDRVVDAADYSPGEEHLIRWPRERTGPVGRFLQHLGVRRKVVQCFRWSGPATPPTPSRGKK